MSRTTRHRLRAPRREASASSPAVIAPSAAELRFALAHLIERLIDEGRIDNYADAARLLGVTRARVTQLQLLLGLSPHIAARILASDLKLSERRLRPIATEVEWIRQQELLVNCETKTMRCDLTATEVA